LKITNYLLRVLPWYDPYPVFWVWQRKAKVEEGQSGERPKGRKAKEENGQRTIGQIKTKRPNTFITELTHFWYSAL
jgi:hypothetical protein